MRFRAQDWSRPASFSSLVLYVTFIGFLASFFIVCSWWIEQERYVFQWHGMETCYYYSVYRRVAVYIPHNLDCHYWLVLRK